MNNVDQDITEGILPSVNKKISQSSSMSYQPAKFGKRFVAFIIDNLFAYLGYYIIAFGIGLIIGTILMLIYPIDFDLILQTISPLLDVIEFIIMLLFLIIYPLIKDGLFNGQSVGKKILSLRTVNFTNQQTKCSFGESIKRNIVFWLPFSELIAAAQIIDEPSRRRIGDGFANTVVVDLKAPAEQIENHPDEKKSKLGLLLILLFLLIPILIIIALVVVGLLLQIMG